VGSLRSVSTGDDLPGVGKCCSSVTELGAFGVKSCVLTLLCPIAREPFALGLIPQTPCDIASQNPMIVLVYRDARATPYPQKGAESQIYDRVRRLG
jgi:hypothetical protein